LLKAANVAANSILEQLYSQSKSDADKRLPFERGLHDITNNGTHHASKKGFAAALTSKLSGGRGCARR
jgi:hypothetical protein